MALPAPPVEREMAELDHYQQEQQQQHLSPSQRFHFQTKAILKSSEITIFCCGFEFWKWMLFALIGVACFATALFLWVTAPRTVNSQELASQVAFGFFLGGFCLALGLAIGCAMNTPPHFGPRNIRFHDQQMAPPNRLDFTTNALTYSPRILRERSLVLGTVGVLDPADLHDGLEFTDAEVSITTRARVASLFVILLSLVSLILSPVMYYIPVVVSLISLTIGFLAFRRCASVSSITADDCCHRDCRGAIVILRILAVFCVFGSFICGMAGVSNMFLAGGDTNGRSLVEALIFTSRPIWGVAAIIGATVSFVNCVALLYFNAFLISVQRRVVDRLFVEESLGGGEVNAADLPLARFDPFITA